jgi:hypothetical protein
MPQNMRVTLQTDTGFAAYHLVDPVIVSTVRRNFADVWFQALARGTVRDTVERILANHLRWSPFATDLLWNELVIPSDLPPS